MKLRLFQIDAFTSKVFRGNPAAVCPLEDWLENRTLQSIAAENNLSETAFFVPTDNGFHLRWFTPKIEVDLCGHATLAAAFVIFTELEPDRQTVRFETKSGPLFVKRESELLSMDFPAWQLQPCTEPPTALLQGLGRKPQTVFSVEPVKNYFAIFADESEVASITPDHNLLEQLHPNGVVVTAPGKNSDCASRYFVPSYGIPEDPVTGSIHCGLVPYWATRLNKKEIYARQISERGGELFCQDQGDRVQISGQAIKYLEGFIYLDR